MTKQIITIDPSGALSGLQRKPGQGINLQAFGRAETVRASEIAWDEDAQRWTVDVLQAAGKGLVTLNAFTHARDAIGCNQSTADLDRLAPHGWCGDGDGILRFRDYDDAVKVEIAFLDALRLSGKF